MNEEQQLQKRFEELSRRSEMRGEWVYSDFLSTASQALLLRMTPASGVEFYGGYSGAERRVACFGSTQACSGEAQPKIMCVKIAPSSKKFADALTHRDFLGSVMALGVRREVLGDIIVHENCGYLFCEQSIGKYIIGSLGQVKHTAVSCSEVSSPPVESVAPPCEEEIVIASERLDAVAAEVYNLSRSESKLLAEQGKVSINSVLSENPSRILNPHDVVSVRGKGRFIYEGIVRETKKGKLRASVRIYK